MLYLILLFIVVTILSTGSSNTNGNKDPLPIFPLQFSATIEITSHLIDNNSEYPPNKRHITVYYDYINKKARADIEAGYEAAKYYIRRYDQKKEYMIRLPPIDDCKRSYLGEVMPFPDIDDASFINTQEIDGVEYSIPVKLIQESTVDGVSTPLLTYDYSDVELGAPDDSWFALPPPLTHKSCVRHTGGFPYLHIFHYFVRF